MSSKSLDSVLDDLVTEMIKGVKSKSVKLSLSKEKDKNSSGEVQQQ
jgi:hypothetical protein